MTLFLCLRMGADMIRVTHNNLMNKKRRQKYVKTKKKYIFKKPTENQDRTKEQIETEKL